MTLSSRNFQNRQDVDILTQSQRTFPNPNLSVSQTVTKPATIEP